MVAVAQLVRASGCGPEGRRFESDQPPHFFAQIGQKNMKPVKASLHAAAKRRFMHRRCASYGEAVLHKTALPDEAAPFHSAMKHFAFAPYDLSSIALRATDDEKMKNESFRLQ